VSLIAELGWRLGVCPVRAGRGLLVVDPVPSAQVRELVARFASEMPRVNLYHAGGAAALAPGVIDVQLPFGYRPIVRRWLKHLKIQVIVFSGQAAADELLLSVAMQLGVKLAVIGPAHEGLQAHRQRVALWVDGNVEPDDGRFAELMVSQRGPGKGSHARGLDRLLVAPLVGGLLRAKYRRLESLQTLKQALGDPRRILCLGNGPSSEDPALAAVHYDALFRVNHSWLERKHHADPDMVFTGQKSTLRACGGDVIYGFQTVAAESQVLMRALLLPMRIRYITATRLGCIDSECFAPHKPSNGAVMLATAVALQPASLVVAGIDLFSDPRGAYPGAPETPNAYTPAHDRELEARFILRTLAGYGGELEIYGDVLRARWAQYQQQRDSTTR